MLAASQFLGNRTVRAEHSNVSPARTAARVWLNPGRARFSHAPPPASKKESTADPS